MRKLALASALLVAVVGLAHLPSGADAAVTRLEIASTAPYGSFKPGDYARWDARIVGELSPTAEPIPDLEKASRNARGMVEYSTRLTVIAPAERARGNGALLIDVPNRGRAISSSLYNSPRHVLVPLGSFDQGTGFLQDYGYTVAVVAWELGYGVDLPTFTGPDGKPRYVEGAALAIVRDVADFLANASADSTGQRNPLAGTINRTLALGYSQTGRFLKSFLVRGFNTAEGRRVFAGIHILGAASGHILLRSVPGPTSGAGAVPTFADPEVRGVNEEPLAIPDLVAR
jgi:alpha/beta hydrolase family protein